MKKLLYLLLGAVMVVSCDNNNLKELEELIIEPDGVEIIVTPTEVTNVFILSTNIVQKDLRWDFGKNNGKSYIGTKVRAIYAQTGVYTVTLHYRSPKTYEILTKTKDIVIDTYNPDIDDSSMDPVLYYLSGGVEQLEGNPDEQGGKTWAVDSLSFGHYGTGPNGDKSTVWWWCDPMNFSGMGLYDDEMIFFSDGKFGLVNHGTTIVGDAALPALLARGATDDWPGGGEHPCRYIPDVSGWTWDLVEEEGIKYIVFPDNEGFPLYFSLPCSPYRCEIIEITRNTMYLTVPTVYPVPTDMGDGNYWGTRYHLRFTAK